MKRLFLILFSLFTLANLEISAQINSVLKELDEYIDKKDYYIELKEKKISVLKQGLLTKTGNLEKLSYYNSLFNEYKSYKYDSAYVYAHKCLEIATAMNNPSRIIEANEHIAFCYLSSGLFKEAFDIMSSVNLDKGSESAHKDYYTLLSRLYYDMADYNNAEPFRSEYVQKGNMYSDSTIKYLSNDSLALWSVLALKKMKQNQMDEAISIFKTLSESTIDDHTYAIAASSLAFIYEGQGNQAEAIHYMALASIGDIKGATKETVALRNLATLLYKKGDIHRAYKYIRLAMEDANFYNARHRKIGISSILPIIEKDRFEQVEKQRNILIGSVVIISMLFLLLLSATLVIYKQMKKLKEARNTIQEQNKSLLSTNAQLLEAIEIKDEYIVQSLYGNSEYIDRLEKLYKLVNRKIIARQYDDLKDSLKESDLRKERENMYSSFDNTFLKLFPHFVDEYNMLFNPQDRIEIDVNKGLTPEIRIFALIRLGIHENERIAKFLNYSVHTINTYKTKVKNKSTVPNELFEQRIMEIKTIRSN